MTGAREDGSGVMPMSTRLVPAAARSEVYSDCYTSSPIFTGFARLLDSTSDEFPIRVWIREYVIRYFGKTFISYHIIVIVWWASHFTREEEGSGVVSILELYQCLAVMPVCKPKRAW